MRQLKFRAWDKKTKQIVEVVAIVYSDFQIEAGCDDNLGDPVIDEGIWINIGNECFIEEPRDFKDVELMQYTGLKDKNGKEIYEGDVLQSYPTQDVVFVVGHGKNSDNDSFGFTLISTRRNKIYDFEMSVIGMEVIGNIHENPELVEGVVTND